MDIFRYNFYGSSRIVIIFTSVRWVGGGGSWAAVVRSLKMSFMVHCSFEKGSQNQHFRSTLFVGRDEGYNIRVLCVRS